MLVVDLKPMNLAPLQEIFGDRVQSGVLLARYTAARLGGPADAFLEAHSISDLAEAVSLCWQRDLPYVILGGGSNVLVSDLGVRGLVILNKSRRFSFDESSDPPTAWAESGVNFGMLARQAGQRGLAGLEWAAGIPGTVGGAVVGNAGAHGSDMTRNLRLAEILHRSSGGQQKLPQRESWPLEKLEYSYRSSVLKRRPGEAVVLAAKLELEWSTPQVVQARIDEYVAHRRRTQPPGASMGSMFKNPPGDYAGRLIEAAGLKGMSIGDAQISVMHANFFINKGNASARDIYDLIQMARQEVAEKFGVELELEIELIGEW